MEISHEEFNTSLKEKNKHEKMKENVKNVSEYIATEKPENMTLNSVDSKT